MADQRKAVIKNADMSEPMQQDAVDVASVALSKYNIEKVRSSTIVPPLIDFRLSTVRLTVFFFFCLVFFAGCCGVHQERI